MTTKKKTCFDCLHCKVLVKSTENCMFCFCARAEKKVKHEWYYWFAKKVCCKFDDMGSKQFITYEKKIEGGNKRRPLMAWRY